MSFEDVHLENLLECCLNYENIRREETDVYEVLMLTYTNELTYAPHSVGGVKTYCNVCGREFNQDEIERIYGKIKP